MSTENRVYTVEEVAKVLRTGRSATYEAVRRGEIPSIRVGRFYRIPASFVRQLDAEPEKAG